MSSRWLLPVACLLALAGYFGPWIDHRAAGLVITGLDLGEIVKFVPSVRTGEIALWRPGFYAPLAAVGAACALSAFRPHLGYPHWMKAFLLGIALVAALNLVPPAWTPRRLLEPEFRWQGSVLVLLVIGILFSPFLGLLPRSLAGVIITALAALGILLPVVGFFSVLPAFDALYRQPLAPGWGMWAAVVGLALLSTTPWLRPRPARVSHPIEQPA